LPGHIWKSLANFKTYGAVQAAALAYYSIFSVFPLTLLLAVGVSSILGPAVAQEQIAQGLELFLPPETVDLLRDNLIGALQQGSSFGTIALVTLVWSALGLFSNLTSSLDMIFKVSASRSLWRQRLLAFLMTIVLVMLVLMSFVTSGVLRLVSAFLLGVPSTWITIGTLCLPLGLDMVIFVMLFRYVPARHVHWDAVWPAAILGAVGWELGKAGFGWYLTNLANFAFVYGGIATVIVLLFWAYLAASILLFSAEFCAQLNDWFTDERARERSSNLLEGGAPRLPPEVPPRSPPS
jgi:membrane protein